MDLAADFIEILQKCTIQWSTIQLGLMLLILMSGKKSVVWNAKLPLVLVGSEFIIIQKWGWAPNMTVYEKPLNIFQLKKKYCIFNLVFCNHTPSDVYLYYETSKIHNFGGWGLQTDCWLLRWQCLHESRRKWGWENLFLAAEQFERWFFDVIVFFNILQAPTCQINLNLRVF